MFNKVVAPKVGKPQDTKAIETGEQALKVALATFDGYDGCHRFVGV